MLSTIWKDAAQRNELPTQQVLAAAVKSVTERHWQLNAAESTASHLSDAALSFNAIAKGYIVEAACQAALKDQSNIRGLVVNLGGDLRVCGESVERVAIADPFQSAENSAPLTTVVVKNEAVATSGNYRRGFEIGGRRYSHLLDPRTGQPVEEIVSATVIASSSADADALATICNVLSPRESLALVESQAAACLLIARDGQQWQSARWRQYEPPRSVQFTAAPAAEKSELLELTVNIELARPVGAQYRRPYVAIWLEDADENAVRTGLLFMMTKEPGPRWHRNLNRWYKQDNLRQQAGGRKVIGVVSSASRGPGEYRAVFDGLDDEGRPLKAGKYTLFLEIAREHGTYQIIRQPLELGAKPIELTQLKSNAELKSASFEYREPNERPARK